MIAFDPLDLVFIYTYISAWTEPLHYEFGLSIPLADSAASVPYPWPMRTS